METTVFTPTQQHLLKMFSYDKSEKTLLEVKQVLADYFARKLDERLDEAWDSGVLNQDKLDELRGEHLRTPYKQ